MTDPIGRLLPYRIGRPAENMAIDQAILEHVNRTGRATLRCYGWNEPTLSLGYFQNIADRDRHPSSKQLPVVRRASGGGAIVHHHELTYSVALRVNRRSVGQNRALYESTHLAIIRSLSEFGVHAASFRSLGREPEGDHRYLCFQRRTEWDLVVSGYKVLGSAQRRTQAAVLQHGSLLLRTSRWATELPGIAELSSIDLQIPDFVRCFARNLGTTLSIHWEPERLSDAETERATESERNRFSTTQWLKRR